MEIYLTDDEYRTIKKALKRNLYHNLKKLDRRIDDANKRWSRIYKGAGDIVGFLMTAAGAITFMGGVACADSISTDHLNMWGFCMICSLLSIMAGAKILSWMRS